MQGIPEYYYLSVKIDCVLSLISQLSESCVNSLVKFIILIKLQTVKIIKIGLS